MKIFSIIIICGLIGLVFPDFYKNFKEGDTIRYLIDILLLMVLYGIIFFILKKRKEEIKEKGSN
ncbi:hypothetical protein ACIQ4I_03315 [Rummeliibacillus sp. NPDC094406]|uniref:hypothetical protein n=1 Tax=Rummeliibacillus sp. NPDC094406 TaxID=3364511 RepID=UPI003826E9BF